MTKLKKTGVIILAILGLGAAASENGCKDQRVDTTMHVKKLTEDRFIVTRIGIFEDDMAYNNKRAIYLIRDTATGKEYFGLSGVGISQLGKQDDNTVER